MTRYVICYDIPGDKRRTKLAKRLCAFGRRVQYSVFEAVLDRPLFDNLIEMIESIIQPQDDYVTIYAICRACSGKRVVLGRGAKEKIPGEEIVYVV